MSQAPLHSVESVFARMAEVLEEHPERFEAVKGDVAFFVHGATSPWWHVTRLQGHIVIRPGNSSYPVVSIGIIPEALSWLVDGSLDVEKAFRKKRLAVQGDFDSLAAFVQCFEE